MHCAVINKHPITKINSKSHAIIIVTDAPTTAVGMSTFVQ